MRVTYKKLVLTAALMVPALLMCATGCRESELGHIDAAIPTDGSLDSDGHLNPDGSVTLLDGGPPDMSVVGGTSVHALYVAMPPQGTPAVLTDVVVTGIATTNGKSSAGNCQYQAYVQDRQGTVPPLGVRLFAKGSMCTQGDGGSTCSCPYPPNTGTPLDVLDDSSKLGAVATVHGFWMPYAPKATDAGAQPTQNELVVTSLDLTGATATPTPFVITDPAQLTYNGQGFINYESTLVTFQPSAPFAATAPDTFGAFEGDGARFVGTYRYVYSPRGAPLPVAGQKFTSVTGVATLPYGGGIAARTPDDFVAPPAPDMGTTSDDGGLEDGSVADMTPPAPPTVHGLYVNPPATNAAVSLSGLVVTGVATTNGTTSAGYCKYQAYVQDADSAGTTAPNGIRLYATGPKCTQQDGGTGCACPYPPNTGTPFDVLDDPGKLGALVDVEGKWSTYTPTSGGVTQPTQHELTVTKLTTTGGGGTASPFTISDPSLFGNNGAVFIDYESTLVTFQPASTFTISAPDTFGAFDGGGAHFIGTYRYVYSPDKAHPFPTGGASFSAITGIADLPFGGGVAPRNTADFVP